jgi:dTDP-4-dehydrorhamnose reductase
MSPKILLTGGAGLLGTQLQQYFKCDAPTIEEFDITQPIKPRAYDLIIHCAAYTDVVKAEVEKDKCFAANVVGTYNLVNAYKGVPFVHISTEYVYEPVNFYALTKLEAEKVVSDYRPYLIIRTLFKPRPFPFEKAFMDQYTNGDYVDVIAPMIATAILQWDWETSEVVNIGTGRKTIYELARQSRPDVEPCSIEDIKEVRLPTGKNTPEVDSRQL